MNVTVLFCLVLAVVAISASDIPEEFKEFEKTCAAENNIKSEQLPELHKYEYLKELDASEDAKCYAKCLTTKTGVINDSGIDAERFVEISIAFKQDGAKALEKIEKCKTLYKGTKDCQDAWNLYVCSHETTISSA